MADLKLIDVRKYAIEQEASILLRSSFHERAAEVSSHGIIRWVRTGVEKESDWLLAPVDDSFEEVLAKAEEFVIQKSQVKPLVYTRDKFTQLLALKPEGSTSATHSEEE